MKEKFFNEVNDANATVAAKLSSRLQTVKRPARSQGGTAGDGRRSVRREIPPSPRRRSVKARRHPIFADDPRTATHAMRHLVFNIWHSHLAMCACRAGAARPANVAVLGWSADDTTTRCLQARLPSRVAAARPCARRVPRLRKFLPISSQDGPRAPAANRRSPF